MSELRCKMQNEICKNVIFKEIIYILLAQLRKKQYFCNDFDIFTYSHDCERLILGAHFCAQGLCSFKRRKDRCCIGIAFEMPPRILRIASDNMFVRC